MKSWLLFLALLFSLPSIPILPAQNSELETSTASSIFEFFYQQQGPLPVLKLETDWKKLVRDKLKEEYQDGVLSFTGPDGSTANLDVSIRARGNTRKEVCQLPPVKIKANRKQLQELGFNPSGKLKLVLPCQSGKAEEECLLKEALAYKLYEAVYPVHHRTRVVKLEAWQKDKQKYSLYAFLVEEEKEFAGRVEGKRNKQDRTNTIDLERDAYVKMCFFQYMIANTDWSAPNSHNMEILQLPGHEKLVPIPYDFDYAGLVETDYAIPRSSIPIEEVTQRFFLGKYVTEEEALECAEYFLSRKKQIIQACRDFDLLEEKTRDSLVEFLSEFFNMLEDKEVVLQSFVTRPSRVKKN